MKKLLLLLSLTLTFNVMAGPVVIGNGGGGVKVNGVYKTFLSAGLYINPVAETNIPGAELYAKTILSLKAKNGSLSFLLAKGLPIGPRKFYKIIEDKMDADLKDRLLEEYARAVKQPKESLTIFAITDTTTSTTYLLPNFYKLSEVEQAAILFHEAFWIMFPYASYRTVIAAESSFQEFVEAKEAGSLNMNFLHFAASYLVDDSLSLKTALDQDIKTGSLKGMFSNTGTIKLKDLFFNDENLCEITVSTKYNGTTIFGENKNSPSLLMKCSLTYKDLKDVLVASRKYPKSLFLKELMLFISNKHYFYFYQEEILGSSSQQEVTAKFFNKTYDFNELAYFNIDSSSEDGIIINN